MKICRKFCRNLSTTGCKGNTFSRMLLNIRKQCLNQHDAVPLLKAFSLFYGQRFEFQTIVHNAAWKFAHKMKSLPNKRIYGSILKSWTYPRHLHKIDHHFEESSCSSFMYNCSLENLFLRSAYFLPFIATNLRDSTFCPRWYFNFDRKCEKEIQTAAF